MTSTKPQLTVLVGAGSSVAAGAPSTAGLTRAVVEGLRAREPYSCAASQFRDQVEAILAAADDYYHPGAESGEANFEQLLDVFESGAALAVGWQAHTVSTTSESCLTRARPDLGDALTPSFFRECVHVVEQTVLDAIIEASRVDLEQPLLAGFRAWWRALGERFDLTVGCLNYDTLIESALDLGAANQGFVRIAGEGTWRLSTDLSGPACGGHRLFHLHGSIHFGAREYGADPNRFAYDAGFHELYWHPTPGAAYQTMWGQSAPRSQSGRELGGGRLLTGLHKADKTLTEPMASYYLEFCNQLVRSSRLLIAGYGFQDHHINAALRRFVRAHGGRGRVAVVDYMAAPERDDLGTRADMQVFLQRFAADVVEIRQLRSSPQDLGGDRCRVYWKGLTDADPKSLASFLLAQ
ncbi:MAG: SIR2 family protein [Myxococcales bacterium]|nr:SIR2 family protein [Myxococcales bacterium]